MRAAIESRTKHAAHDGAMMGGSDPFMMGRSRPKWKSWPRSGVCLRLTHLAYSSKASFCSAAKTGPKGELKVRFECAFTPVSISPCVFVVGLASKSAA